MQRKPWDWTEQDLLALRGQPESLRLEFKSSLALLNSNPEPAETLSKEVSAFANSEGGTIVIGMKERKEGKTRVADDIDDGLDPTKTSAEWLQQLIESNVSPYLPGIRVRPIPLSGPKKGRVAFVVWVPQGSTAYQAKDRRYYSRSEYESKPMPDHEIRIRMQRGQIAQASVEISDCNYSGWHLQFYLYVINVGEVTIREFMLLVRFEGVKIEGYFSEEIPVTDNLNLSKDEFRYRFPSSLPQAKEYLTAEDRIYPGDRVNHPRGFWRIGLTDSYETRNKPKLLWTVLLDDAPSNSGEIDLLSFLPPEYQLRFQD